MRGKRMAFVDKATTAGYLFPLAYLREQGIADPSRLFSDMVYHGSHDAAISAVLENQADIGAAKNTIYDHLRKDNPRIDKELAIIATSPAVPSNGLCVRKDLPEPLRRKLKDALLAAHQDPEGAAMLRQFGALRFIETTSQDYRPVHDMAQKAGIDLNTYQYRNK
jgi:phosphonate transport system substrate-binding protein